MNAPEIPTRGLVLGIDYGTVRIGIAAADLEFRLAGPLENYNRVSPQADAAKFRQLAQQERPKLFVVGLPVHNDGHESQKSQEVRAFGKWLHEITGVPVVYHDERYTSLQAEQLLQAAQLTKKKRKARLDMLAAQLLLQSFLDSATPGQDSPGGLED